MHKKIEKDVEYNRNLNTQISRYEKSEIDLIKEIDKIKNEFHQHQQLITIA